MIVRTSLRRTSSASRRSRTTTARRQRQPGRRRERDARPSSSPRSRRPAARPTATGRSTRSTTRTAASQAGTSASASSSEPTGASRSSPARGALDDARRGRRRPERPRALVSPGRVAPTNSAWTRAASRSRPSSPTTASKLFVIVNHFNSKGGDQGLFGPVAAAGPVLRGAAERAGDPARRLRRATSSGPIRPRSRGRSAI